MDMSMDIDEFWGVIEQARAMDGKPFDEALADLLAELPLERILDFEERCDDVHDSVYHWDVWAAAYLIVSGGERGGSRAGVASTHDFLPPRHHDRLGSSPRRR